MLITEIVDLDRYPLDRDQSLAGLAGDCAEAFAADGVVALPGFVRPEGVARMAEECDAAAPDGHHSEVTNTVYLGLPHDGVDPEDPRARTVRSSLRAVAADCIPQTHALRQLYEWAPLREFLRHVLGVTELHPYADPLGALNIADMTVEDELGWHFDQTDFVTSLSIRTAGVGGHFEVAAGLRTATDENLTAVRSVLDGATDGVVQLRFDPGTLLIFAGRWSMHRVTPIEAGPSRLVGLLAFDTKPGTDSSELLKLVRYGRTAARDVPWVAATGGE